MPFNETFRRHLSSGHVGHGESRTKEEHDPRSCATPTSMSFATNLESLAAKVASLNTPPKYVVIRKAHLPDPREHGAVPAEWRTKCGRP